MTADARPAGLLQWVQFCWWVGVFGVPVMQCWGFVWRFAGLANALLCQVMGIGVASAYSIEVWVQGLYRVLKFGDGVWG